MGNTRKILIGLGIASGAIFAAWLLSGPRRERTRAYFEQKVRNIRGTASAKRKKVIYDDSETRYV